MCMIRFALCCSTTAISSMCQQLQQMAVRLKNCIVTSFVADSAATLSSTM